MIEIIGILLVIACLYYLYVSKTNKVTNFISGAMVGTIITLYVVVYWFTNKMSGFMNF